MVSYLLPNTDNEVSMMFGLRKLCLYILVLFVTIVSSQTIQAKQRQVSRYFPSANCQRTYISYDKDGKPFMQSHEIVSLSRKIASYTEFKVTKEQVPMYKAEGSSDYASPFTVASIVKVMKDKIIETKSADRKHPQIMLRSLSKWEVETGLLYARTIKTNETVTTKAGKFSGCIVVEETYKGEKMLKYYAPDIGLVLTKMRFEKGLPYKVFDELVDYIKPLSKEELKGTDLRKYFPETSIELSYEWRGHAGSSQYELTKKIKSGLDYNRYSISSKTFVDDQYEDETIYQVSKNTVSVLSQDNTDRVMTTDPLRSQSDGITSINKTVEVVAGEFKHCIEVTRREAQDYDPLTAAEMEGSITYRRYYAPAVGLILIKIKLKGGSDYILYEATGIKSGK